MQIIVKKVSAPIMTKHILSEEETSVGFHLKRYLIRQVSLEKCSDIPTASNPYFASFSNGL